LRPENFLISRCRGGKKKKISMWGVLLGGGKSPCKTNCQTNEGDGNKHRGDGPRNQKRSRQVVSISKSKEFAKVKGEGFGKREKTPSVVGFGKKDRKVTKGGSRTRKEKGHTRLWWQDGRSRKVWVKGKLRTQGNPQSPGDGAKERRGVGDCDRRQGVNGTLLCDQGRKSKQKEKFGV